ncbi:hypothetical protein [Catenuloplanes japonicus]|uniref:hypothetical protein n=1 Tax=Catenuloplanes japonicus TaxID=33876 RepID=UPI00052675B4|nr:hypothetical protein [Catenuloplanes japonicus]
MRDGGDLRGRDTPAGRRPHHLAVFFTGLNGHMRAGPSTDAVTALPAPAYARRPLPSLELITALSWPDGRLHRVLHAVAEVGGQLTVRRDDDGRYASVADTSRLTPARRATLDQG